MSRSTTLYRRTAGGLLQFWKIEITGTQTEVWITREWGAVGGDTQCVDELVEENASGRNVIEQADLQFDSMVSKKLDKGYVANRNVAMENAPRNRLGLARPMLAKPLKNIKRLDPQHFSVQNKLDGHRCLIHCEDEDEELIAYSRNGKPIATVKHLLDELRGKIKPGYTLDGELYCHGVPLQRISSWVKRRQPSTLNLTYVIFDVIAPGGFSERNEYIQGIGSGSYYTVMPCGPLESLDNIPPLLDLAVSSGYEGLILRDNRSKYEDGKRSSSLIKVKQFLDAEFEVVDVTEAKDGSGILWCRCENGKVVSALAPGTLDEKAEILINKLKYIGKHVTLQYASLTEDGKPFHPVAKAFREDI